MNLRVPVGLVALVLAVFALLPLGSAEAHSLRPGFLILVEQSAGSWEATWTAPTAEPQLVPTVRGGCTMERSPERWSVRCPTGADESELVVRGIQKDSTEVIVRIAPLEGGPVMVGLSLGNEITPLQLSEEQRGKGGGFLHWVELGVEHILIGADHLFFVLGLVLLIATTRELLVTITSFTLAHSITLGGASLGYLSLPSAPVEAVIALSIVLLAVELLRGDEASLSRRKPWLVAFGFGLLHGFGFAGVLGELGLPDESIWMPLLAFNLGVELGQLAFVLVIFAPAVWIRARSGLLRVLPAYAIGTVASAWTIERVLGFWG